MAPFARLIAQLVIVCGGAVARAVLQAYKEAAQKGIQAGSVPRVLKRRMSIDEAGKILEVDISSVTQEEVLARYLRLHNINAPTETFSGSPYLRKKVENAKIILEENCLYSKKPSHQPSSESSTSSKPHRMQAMHPFFLCFPLWCSSFATPAYSPYSPCENNATGLLP